MCFNLQTNHFRSIAQSEKMTRIFLHHFVVEMGSKFHLSLFHFSLLSPTHKAPQLDIIKFHSFFIFFSLSEIKFCPSSAQNSPPSIIFLLSLPLSHHKSDGSRQGRGISHQNSPILLLLCAQSGGERSDEEIKSSRTSSLTPTAASTR